MPKLKQTPLAQIGETVQRNIASRGAFFGLKTDRDFAERLNMSHSTYRSKRIEPRLWTLADLVRLSVVLKCPLQWLVTDHSGEME